MLRCILVCLAVLASNAWSENYSTRRIESSLARNAQDRQFVHQQAQITQALVRGEESLTISAESAMPFIARRGFALVERQDRVPSARARQYQDELDRLASRYRELEAQRADLVQKLSTRRQQSRED